MNADHPGTAVTNEIWLGRPPPARPPFDVLRVITRQSIQDGLAGDPLARGSLLALVVASLAWRRARAGRAAPRRRRRPARRARRALRPRGAGRDSGHAAAPPALRALMLVGMRIDRRIVTARCSQRVVVSLVEGDGERSRTTAATRSRSMQGVLASGAARVRRRRRRPRRRCDLERLPQPRGRTLREVGW